MSRPKKRKQPRPPSAPTPHEGASEERQRGFEHHGGRRGESDVERGPTSDVGGPHGIERGVGLETGEETP